MANVGTLEVGVDINSGKATATFVKAMKAAGEAGGEALEDGLNEVETKKLETQLKLLRAKIEVIFRDTGVKLNFEGEFEKLNAELGLRKAKFEANKWDIPLDVFDEELKVQLAVAERLIEEATREREIKIAAELEIKEFQAEVKRLESFKYGAEFEAVLETAKLEYEAKIIADRERELEFTAELRASLFYAELEAIERDERAVKIAAELEKTEFLAEVARLESFKYGTEFEAVLETAKFDFERRRIEETKANITVELETALAKAQEAKLRAQIKSSEIDIGVNFDPNTLDLAQLRLIRELQEADDIEIPVKLKIEKFKKANLGNNLPSDMTKVFLGLGLVAGDALITGIAGALAAGTAVISSAAQGLVGAVVPTAAILGGLAGVLGAVVVGSQGFGTALGAVSKELEKANEEGRDFDILSTDIQDALRNLAPEAAEVAVAFADIRLQFVDIRKEVQANLFSGLAKEITALSDSSGKAESTIEDFGEFLKIAAQSANRFIEALIEIGNTTNFAKTFTAIQPAVDAIFDTIVSLVDTFEPFLQAAAPAAASLAVYLSQSASALNRWTTGNVERISQILLDGVESLTAWTGLIGNLGGLLADVFSAGQQSGDNFVTKLDVIITKFREFLTADDSQRLKDFFAFGERAIADFKPVVVGLGDALKTLTSEDAQESFESLAQTLGDLLPAFADLLLQIGQLELLQTSFIVFGVLASSIALVIEALGPAAKAFGVFLVSVSIAVKLTALVKSIQLLIPVIKALGVAIYTSLGPLGLFAAAIGVAIAASVVLEGSNQQMKERTEELEPVLRSVTEELIAEADAANAASVGFDALQESLLTTGEDGEKLRFTLGLLGIDAADTIKTLASVGAATASDSERVASLKELASAFGFTGDAAQLLGELVDLTDENFLKNRGAQSFEIQLQAIADASGRTFDEVVIAAQALEELQDQAEKTNIQQLAKDFIQYEGSLNTVNLALLVQAEENTGLLRTGEDLFPLYEELTRLMALNNIATELSSQLKQEEIMTLQFYGEAAEQAARETAELTAKLDAEREAALKLTYDALGPLSENLQTMTAKLKEGAEKATAFKSRLDALVPTAFGVEGALDGAQLSINELVAAIVTEEQAFVGFEELLNGTSTAAIEQRTALRDTAAEIFSYGEAALEGGVGAGEAALKVDELSGSLAAQLKDLELSTDQVEQLLTQYGLTPDQINTVFGSNAVQQKGVVDEYVGALNGTLLEIDTNFVADGLDPSTGLTRRALENYELGLDDLNGRIVITDIQAPNIDAVTTGVNDLDIAFDELPPTTELFIEIPGLAEDIIGVNDLALAVVNLPTSKTIYVNTVFSSSGNSGSGSGSASDPSSPDFFSATAPSSTSNVTNHFNISGVSDAQAVATQVVNRTALAVM